jgi:GNAT superfamily N-acetyltransferase
MMSIIGPSLAREADCEAVLRSLPDWFGIEESLLMYAHDSALMPTFGIEEPAGLAGFITLRQHFPEAWEVHCIAVKASSRNQGFGSLLLSHAEQWLSARGARFLQVKTISDSHASAHYGQTRAFYLARGYTPIECFRQSGIPATRRCSLSRHCSCCHALPRVGFAGEMFAGGHWHGQWQAHRARNAEKEFG